jgi:hypothetical protein
VDPRAGLNNVEKRLLTLLELELRPLYRSARSASLAIATAMSLTVDQCCPTFLCTRAQFTDAYGGAGATTLLLLLVVVLLLNTTISTTS